MNETNQDTNEPLMSNDRLLTDQTYKSKRSDVIMLKISIGALRSVSNSPISATFVNNLTRLFKQGEYQAIIQKIDQSEFKSAPHLLRMKAVAYRAIGEENLELSKFYEQQSVQGIEAPAALQKSTLPDRKPPILDLKRK